MRKTTATIAATVASLLALCGPSASADTVAARYSFRDANCSSSQISDPVSIIFRQWYHRTDLESDILGAPSRRHWGDVSGGSQYSKDSAGTCRFWGDSLGREFGRPAGTKQHREKEHLRFFTFGTSEWNTTPHREYKATTGTCGADGRDSVYVRYNGLGGFDAGRAIVLKGFRSTGSATATDYTARSPFKRTYTQCAIDSKTGRQAMVPWTGDITYLTNRNPDYPTGP